MLFVYNLPVMVNKDLQKCLNKRIFRLAAVKSCWCAVRDKPGWRRR